mgnify:FL=1
MPDPANRSKTVIATPLLRALGEADLAAIERDLAALAAEPARPTLSDASAALIASKESTLTAERRAAIEDRLASDTAMNLERLRPRIHRLLCWPANSTRSTPKRSPPACIATSFSCPSTTRGWASRPTTR